MQAGLALLNINNIEILKNKSKQSIDYRVSNETNFSFDLASDATTRDHVIRSPCCHIAAVLYYRLKRIIDKCDGNQTHLRTETITIII